MILRKENIFKKASNFFYFCFLLFFLLAPYLKIPLFGNTGIVAFLLFLTINISFLLDLFKKKHIVNLTLINIVLSVYAYLFGLLFFSDSPMYLSKILFSIQFYIIVGSILNYKLIGNSSINGSYSELIFWLFKMSLYVIVLNSIIVILMQIDQNFKFSIEKWLQPVSNIDYDLHEWRSRGIASSGGASLSIFHSIGIVLTISLALKKRISYLFMGISLFVICVSLIFIGRSGLVLGAFGTILVFFYNFKEVSFLKLFFTSVFFYFIVSVLFKFLEDNIAQSILEYNLYNTFDYDKIKDDNGLNFFLSNHFHFSSNPVALLFGVGSFKESNSLNLYSDSGYMRIFYYYGIPLGIFIILRSFHHLFAVKNIKEIRSIYIPILLLLLFATIKEPIFFTGYSSRLLFLIVGMVSLKNITSVNSF